MLNDKARDFAINLILLTNREVDKENIMKGLKDFIKLMQIPDSCINLNFLIMDLSFYLKTLPSYDLISDEAKFFLNEILGLIEKHGENIFDVKLRSSTANRKSISRSSFPIYYQLYERKYGDLKESAISKTEKFVIRVVFEASIRGKKFTPFLINKAIYSDNLDQISSLIPDLVTLTRREFDQAIKLVSHKLCELKDCDVIPSVCKILKSFPFDNPVANIGTQNKKELPRKRNKYIQEIITSLLDGETKSVQHRPPQEDLELILADSKNEEALQELLVPEIKINGSPVSRRLNYSFAKQTRIKNAMSSQFLKNDRNHLTPHEISVIFSACISDISNKSTLSSIPAFSSLLTLTTGAEPKKWSSWVFTDSEPELGYFINVNEAWICHPINMEKLSWTPSPEQQQYLHPTSNIVVLPIEENLLTFLKKIPYATNKSLSEVLNKDAAFLSEEATSWIKDLFKSQNRWFTISRLRDWLFHEIMSNTMDEAIASHICAQHTLELSPGTNYATFSLSTIHDNYLSSFPDGFKFKSLSQFNSRLIGSKLSIKEEFLKETLAKLKSNYLSLKNKITSKSTLTHIINTHNSYISYIIFMAFINTSHRPVQDPFARKIDFITENKAVFITDKVIGIQNITRLSFYGDCFSEQLVNYENHLKQLSFWLSCFKLNDESAIVNSITSSVDSSYSAYFFYLRQERKKIYFDSVREKKLKEQNPDFCLPWNFGRHLRATKLREFAVPAEYINYDFGHVSAGEQPFGSFSALSVKGVSKVIISAVNKINVWLEIKSLPGIPFLQRRINSSTKLNPFSKPVSLGYMNRQSRRLKSTKQDKDKINNTLESMFKTTDILTQDNVEKGLSNLLDSNPLHLIKSLNIFTLLLKKHLKDNNVQNIKLPCHFIEIKQEKSTFDEFSALNFHQATKIKEVFNHKILTEKFSKTKNVHAKQMLSFLYISLQLNGFISDKKILSEIFTAIGQNNLLITKERLFVQITINNEVYRRIGIDTISSLILNRLLKFEHSLKIKNYALSEIIQNLNSIFIRMNELVTFDFKPSKLASYANVLASLSLPGFICSVLNGNRHFESQNEASYIRYNSSTPLKEKEIKNPLHFFENHPKLNISVPKFNKDNICLKKATQQRSQIYAILRDKSLGNRKIFTKKLLLLNKDFEKDPQTIQITQLFFMWVIYTINSPSKMKERLAIQTVEKMASYVGRYLTEICCTTDILQADSEELEMLYSSIIDISDANQMSRKETLERFHSFLVQNFNSSKIDWDNITVISNDPQSMIDSSLISEKEFSYLTQSIKATNFEFKDEIRLIFSFYFKLGLRVSEIYKISYKEIIIQNEYDSYIILIGNHLGGLKNSNSYRIVYFDNRLTAEEFKLFKKIITQKNNYASTSSIWSIDRSRCTTILNNLIKDLTGDPSLSIRNLRHSYASLNIQKINMLNKKPSDLGIDENIKNWYVKRFNTEYPTRRALYFVAKSLGHGSPSTTLCNYTNNYEEFIPDLINSSNNSSAILSDLNLLSNLTEVNANSIRVKKSRFKKLKIIDTTSHFVSQIIKKHENLIVKKSHYLADKPAEMRIYNNEWKKWLKSVEMVIELHDKDNLFYEKGEEDELCSLYFEMIGFVFRYNFNPFGLKLDKIDRNITSWHFNNLKDKFIENPALLEKYTKNEFKTLFLEFLH